MGTKIIFKNRLRNTRVIVENKVAHFYVAFCRRALIHQEDRRVGAETDRYMYVQ